MIAFTDSLLAGVLLPFPRILLWGIISGAISMGIYAWIAPQRKMIACKALQKDVRAELMKHEGSFSELRSLITKDLLLSFRLCASAIPAVLISFLPAVGILYCLLPVFAETTLPALGAEWTESVEFWYILAACISSLCVKYLFNIT